MPIFNLNVQAWLEACIEFKVLSGLYEVVGPVFVTEPDQPFRVLRDAAYFFGKMRVSTSTITWTMLLLRSGDKAIISDAAARPIAIIAVVVGSIVTRKDDYPHSSLAYCLDSSTCKRAL